MARMELDCLDSTFGAGLGCPNEQAAVEAVRRTRPVIEAFCVAVGGAATAAVTGLFSIIVIISAILNH